MDNHNYRVASELKIHLRQWKLLEFTIIFSVFKTVVMVSKRIQHYYYYCWVLMMFLWYFGVWLADVWYWDDVNNKWFWCDTTIPSNHQVIISCVEEWFEKEIILNNLPCTKVYGAWPSKGKQSEPREGSNSIQKNCPVMKCDLSLLLILTTFYLLEIP